MKRFFLILLLLVPTVAGAQPTPVGQNRWQKDDGKFISTFGANYPLTYQQENQAWDDIAPDWVVVNDTTAKVVRGIHKLFAFKNGNVYYVRPHAGVRHALGLRTSKLIKFKLADSSYTILSDVTYDSISISGPILTYHNIFPGIDRVCVYDNAFYQDKFVFNQAARDTLSMQGPWAGYMLGVVSKIDKDSLYLSLKDRAGIFSPTVGGRITDGWITCVKSDTIMFCLQQSFLETHDSVTSVAVHKRVVTLGGTPYLVELFNPIPTASWPDGPIWHNVVYGYDTSVFVQAWAIENFASGMSFTAISTSGTIDSIMAMLRGDELNNKGRMAVFSDDGSGGYTVVDSVLAFKIGNSGNYVWHRKPALVGATVNPGTRYMIVVTCDVDPLGPAALAYRPSNTAISTDTTFSDYTYDDSTPWTTAPTQNVVADFQRPMAVFLYYTESSASTGQVIIIGSTDEAIFDNRVGYCVLPRFECWGQPTRKY